MQSNTLMNYRKLYLLGITAAAVTLLTALPMSAAMAQDEESGAETDATAEPLAAPTPPTTLERIAANGAIRFGYRTDAQPFSYQDEAGQAAGYSVALCTRIAEQVKSKLGLPSLTVQWIPVDADSRFSQLADGQLDLLCAADSVTLSRREDVAFSLPTFPGGIGALLRADAAARLKLTLEGKTLPNQPLWRGTPAQVLQHKTFSAVAGTTAEGWLAERISTFKILSKAVPVASYDEGVQAVLKGRSDAMFGDRAILLEAMKRSEGAAKLMVVDRLFTLEPIALALARGDEDFRLLVDSTLSQLYASAEFGQFFSETFGEPNEKTLLFYLINTLPQ